MRKLFRPDTHGRGPYDERLVKQREREAQEEIEAEKRRNRRAKNKLRIHMDPETKEEIESFLNKLVKKSIIDRLSIIEFDEQQLASLEPIGFPLTSNFGLFDRSFNGWLFHIKTGWFAVQRDRANDDAIVKFRKVTAFTKDLELMIRNHLVGSKDNPDWKEWSLLVAHNSSC